MSTPSPLASIFAQQMDVTKAPAPVMDYCSADDQFYIRSICSVTGVVLRATARFMRSDGLVIIDSFRHVPNSNRTAALTFHRSIEGYLLSLSVTVEAGTVRRGQCFVQVGLARGTSSNPEFGQLLVSDYATVSGELGYPYSLLRSSLDGPGMLRSVAGIDPAAGVEITDAVPTGARWRLLAWNATFVTSATVANRAPSFIIDDGATTLYRVSSTPSQTASVTDGYSLVPGQTSILAQNGFFNEPAPANVFLFAGWRVRTVTLNLDAGDNWSAAQMAVEEWLEL